MPQFNRVVPAPWKLLRDYISANGHLPVKEYDYMNQSGQLYIMCEYVGWHIGSSNVGLEVLVINSSWTRESRLLYQNLQNSKTFTSSRWGGQSLSAQTM